MSIKNNNNQNKFLDKKSLATYLPFSEHCLKPKFLPNETAVNTFIRLIKESLETHQQHPQMLSAFENHKKPIADILSDMPGLTEEQKCQVIEAAKDLEKQPARKKLECQF